MLKKMSSKILHGWWRPMTTSLMFVLLSHVTIASCVDCGPFGTCAVDRSDCEDGPCPYECHCEDHWTGHDCSLPFVLCPSVGLCLNGGECQAKDEQDEAPNFGCHCHNTIAVNYLDARCGFRPAYLDVCEQDVTHSDYAYCAHGGSCRAIVPAGQPHPLCHCPPEYEGRHCQFAKGTAPPQELAYVQALLGGGDSNKNTKRVWMAVSIGMLLLLLLMVALVYVRRWRARRQFDHNKVLSSLPEIEFTCSDSTGGDSCEGEEEQENDNDEEEDGLTIQPPPPSRTRTHRPRRFGSTARNGPRPEYYYKRKGGFSQRLVV